MEQLRRSSERGTFDFGWLQTAHSFSFGEYYDPRWMNFRSLRVLNEDFIAPGKGFPQHPHRDAEIISVVMRGELTHQDSMGNRGVIRANEVQYMSAGSGVTHSEFNASPEEPVHLIQIWITPEERGATPRYDHRAMVHNGTPLTLLASGKEEDGVIHLRQDVRLYQVDLEPQAEVTHQTSPDRHLWFQLIAGSAKLRGHVLSPGDALAVGEVNELTIGAASEPVRGLLFDLR